MGCSACCRRRGFSQSSGHEAKISQATAASYRAMPHKAKLISASGAPRRKIPSSLNSTMYQYLEAIRKQARRANSSPFPHVQASLTLDWSGSLVRTCWGLASYSVPNGVYLAGSTMAPTALSFEKCGESRSEVETPDHPAWLPNWGLFRESSSLRAFCRRNVSGC